MSEFALMQNLQIKINEHEEKKDNDLNFKRKKH